MRKPFVITGKVYLVGAGPGDPELLTLRAARLLRTADVILHDDLVALEILDMCSVRAQVQSVGKRCGLKKISQEAIHEQMIAHARQGQMVVRLKGGDPLVFGRAGEEIAALRDAKIDYEVVPGITAAFGAAARAGISLTDRFQASRIVFLSNHQCAGKPLFDWKNAVNDETTALIYMPGSDYAGLASRLRADGLTGETPCLLVSNATTERQKVHATTIEKLAEAPRYPAPALLIVGAVVAQYSKEVQHMPVSWIFPVLPELKIEFPMEDAQGQALKPPAEIIYSAE